MTESVTDVIVSRSRRPEQVKLSVLGSVAAHALVIVGLVLLPRGSADAPVREVMMISFGGAEGIRTGGLTQMGGRPVQQVAPEPERPQRAAPETPKMTVPEPKPSRPAPKPPVKTAPAEAAADTPVTGTRTVEGTTPVETTASGPGFGLSSAGGLGGELQLDVSDFCCQEYVEVISSSIKSNWVRDQGSYGDTIVRFTIRRDGTITNIVIEKRSGYYPLDAAAQRAVQATHLPPLPAAFGNPTLTVHMTFRYQR